MVCVPFLDSNFYCCNHMNLIEVLSYPKISAVFINFHFGCFGNRKNEDFFLSLYYAITIRSVVCSLTSTQAKFLHLILRNCSRQLLILAFFSDCLHEMILLLPQAHAMW